MLGSPNQVFYQSANNINSTEGTIDFWLRPTWAGNDGQGHFLLKWGGGGGMLIGKDGANNLRIILNRFGTAPGGEIGVSVNINSWTAGQWHHIAFTFSNTSKHLQVFTDGALRSQTTFTAELPAISDPAFQIGGDGAGGYISSVVDELRISNIARTAQQVAASYISGLTVTSLAATPNTLQMLPTWWKALTLQAATNLGTINVPAVAATWSTTNSAVASFDQSRGKIVASGPGSAMVTAILSGVSTNISVNVTAPILQPTVEPISPFLSTPNPNALWEVPLAIINYLPTTDGINVDPQKTQWTSTLSALRDRVNRETFQLKYLEEERSRFHGYNNLSANPSLGYKVVYIVTVYEEMPEGIPDPGTPGAFFPDYDQILTRFDVAHLVNDLGVKEFFVNGYHFGNIVPVESNMSSPVTGDISNSYRHDDLPVLNTSYVVYGGNFTRNVNLHIYGHQLEAILNYSNIRQDGNTQLFLEKFVGASANGTWQRGRCGDTHHPPNALTDYDYFIPTPIASDIMNWKPSGGQSTMVSSATWNSIQYPLPNNEPQPGPNSVVDDDYRWYTFWMQNMPSRGASIVDGNSRMTDWWQFTGDWDKANRAGFGLYEPASCSYSLSSTVASFAANGGAGSVTVTAGAGCKWFASSNGMWVPLTSGDIGNGTGTVNFSIRPNTTGVARSTRIVVAGLPFVVNQSADAPLVSVNGKVLTSDGRGLRNATVSMTDPFGVTRTATTSSFGFFSFANVTAGGQYVFRVQSRSYRYAAVTATPGDNMTLPDFVGLE